MSLRYDGRWVKIPADFLALPEYLGISAPAAYFFALVMLNKAQVEAKAILGEGWTRTALARYGRVDEMGWNIDKIIEELKTSGGDPPFLVEMADGRIAVPNVHLLNPRINWRNVYSTRSSADTTDDQDCDIKGSGAGSRYKEVEMPKIAGGDIEKDALAIVDYYMRITGSQYRDGLEYATNCVGRLLMVKEIPAEVLLASADNYAQANDGKASAFMKAPQNFFGPPEPWRDHAESFTVPAGASASDGKKTKGKGGGNDGKEF